MPFWDRFQPTHARRPVERSSPVGRDVDATLPKKHNAGTVLRVDDAVPAGVAPDAVDVSSTLQYVDGARLADTYRIERRIGTGGMGTVYLARHERWNLDVALKVPNAEILADPEYRHRTTREAEAWTDLGLHPHIAYCYYVHPIGDVPVLVIEYLDGGNLREWILDGRCADTRLGLGLAIQFCHGLEHAHNKGMVHRDVKPENVLLTSDGTLKVTDFGIVRRSELVNDGMIQAPASGAAQFTVGGIGTLEYMAPEQFGSAQDVDVRADIFAFGVCLYEMFCGRRPYTVAAGAGLEAPEPRELRGSGDLNPKLCELMRQCVHPDRESRPRTVREIREKLNAVYEQSFRAPCDWAHLPDVSLEADGWNNRGATYLELGKEKQASECFEKALGANPAHLESTYNLALLQWRRGRFEDLQVVWKMRQLAGMPGVDAKALALAKAEIQQLRLDPAASRAELAQYPGLYESSFEANEAVSPFAKRTLTIASEAPLIALMSNDGRRALIANHDRLSLVELETGEVTGGFPSMHGIRIFGLDSEGRRGLLAGANGVEVRDLETGKCVRELGGHWALARVTRNFRFALSWGDGNALKLWDLESGRCLQTLGGGVTHLSALAVSADGRWGLSGSAAEGLDEMFTFDGILKKIRPGENIDIEGPGFMRVVNQWETLGSLEAVRRFFPQTLFSSAMGEIKLWELHTGDCLRTWKAHPLMVMALGFGINDAHVVSAGWDGTVKLWNLGSGECTQAPSSSPLEVFRAVIFSGDGSRALSYGEDDTLKLWDLQSPRCLRTWKGGGKRVNPLALAGNGLTALLAHADGEVVHMDLGTRQPRPRTLKLCRPQQFSVVRAGQEALTRVVTEISALLDERRYSEAYTALMQTWEPIGFGMETGLAGLYMRLFSEGTIDRPLIMQPMSWGAHGGRVLSVALGAGGRLALSGGYDGVVNVWDVQGCRCVRSFDGHSGPVRVVAMNCDRGRGFSAGDDQTLRVWDFASGRCLSVITEESSKYQRVAFSVDTDFALLGGTDGMLKLWDLTRGQSLLTFRKGIAPISALAFSADGERAISASGGTLECWEPKKALASVKLRLHRQMLALLQVAVDRKREPQELPAVPIESASAPLHVTHSERSFQTDLALRVAAFAEDGRRAAIGTPGGDILVWPQPQMMLQPRQTETISSVQLARGAKRVLSGSYDGNVKVWDIEHGKALSSVMTPSPVLSLDMTGDDLSALSGHADGTLTRWRIIWSLKFPDDNHRSA